jgi:Big-like domain-containing protein/matrixin
MKDHRAGGRARLLVFAALLATLPGGGVRAGLAPFAVCFAPGTSEAAMQETLARAGSPGKVAAFQAFEGLRWSSTATDAGPLRQGDPMTLTWSVVPDGTSVPGSFGGGALPSDLRAYLDGIHGSEFVWLPVVQRVFDRWGELTGITYVHETADDFRTLSSAPGVLGVRADIRIAGRDVDGPFSVLAYNSFPNDGDMVLDTTETLYDNTAQNSRLLRNVISHEHGHGLAFDHVCPNNGTKLMEPSASAGFEGPQHDDILGAQRLYGDVLEPNDTLATATDLGAPTRKTIISDVSIDDDSDVDWYRFTVPAGTNADVRLIPIGKEYDSGPQGANGCSGEKTRLNTKARTDLRVELVLSPTNVLAAANDVGPGEIEELIDVPLPIGSGAYYVRVRNSLENVAQLYQLELITARRGETPLATDDEDVTWQVLPVMTDVLANDEGLGDEPLSVRVPVKPVNGKAKVKGKRIVYVPAADFAGEDRYTYEVRDAHGQTSLGEVVVTVQASERAGAARVDTDADSYPDEVETWRGTEVNDPGSHPGDVGGGEPLVVDKLVLKVKENKPLRDVLKLRGTIPVEAGFDPQGVVVAVYVAGATREYILDAVGAAAEGDEAFVLRLTRDNGVVVAGRARFDLTVKRADLAPFWADEAVDASRRHAKEPRATTVFLFVGDRSFQTTAALLHKSTGRAAKARLAK